MMRHGCFLHIPTGAEQIMSMPAIRRRWTPEAVRRLNAETPSWPRYELIDGELLVTPSPGHAHQIAVSELLVLLKAYVSREGLGVTLPAPSDVELREGSVTQPDLYVMPAGPSAEAKGLAWSPSLRLLLAVEILSPASVRTDRIVKRDFYLESGVAEYWIVDVEARIVERWTPQRETPLVDRRELSWFPGGSARPLVIHLDEYFDRVQEQARWVRKAFER